MQDRLEELRRSFDRAFSLPPSEACTERENLLGIRAAADRYVLRLSDLSGIVARRKAAPLPGGDPSLLGIAGVRGRMVPVYSLDFLLGYGSTSTSWQWLALCVSQGRDEEIGLAVAGLEGLLRASRGEIRAISGDGEAREHIHEVFRPAAGAAVYGVVGVRSIAAAIRARSRAPDAEKEA